MLDLRGIQLLSICDMPVFYCILYGCIVIVTSYIVWFYSRRSMNAELPSMDAPAEAEGTFSPRRRSRRKRDKPQSSKRQNMESNKSKSGERRRDRLANQRPVTPQKHRDEHLYSVMDIDMITNTQDQSDSTENDVKRTRRKGIEKEIEFGETTTLATGSARMDVSPTRTKNFSHPVYKQMSLKNGLINRMSKAELHTALHDLKLNNLGSGDVLKRRLKNHHTKEALRVAGLSSDVPVHFDYLCVIDVEATCVENNPVDYIHEIIEFPIVLVNTRTLQIEDKFESFCKPIINPQLSSFCSQLTHISQKMVDRADEFPAVLRRAEAWMETKGLGSRCTFAVVTDCSLDMDLYLKMQCLVSEIHYPPYAREWVNISKIFANIYKTKRVPLRTMLDSIGLGFLGQPHRGIDDARNIARITVQLLEDGAELKLNEKLTGS